ncbi:hypothetical protein BV898_05952 [Hypsibius exemplaris]|uniref:Gustatory receptor n=1 Tax=Hypsibius exemplaris TaxID=2072580 RepID=A0A1W0WXM0_HYPEX|nr:hypothetical protein BV898_05952 [Hypsibius exemplaris]
MADQVAVLQTCTLAFLGFLQKRRRPLSTLAEACGAWIRTTVAVAVVGSSMVCLGIDSAKAVKSMINDTMHPFLVTAFLYSPFCLLDLRPVYILAMLLYNRQKFEKLTTGRRSVRRVGGQFSLEDGWAFRRVDGYSGGWTVTPEGGRSVRRVNGYSEGWTVSPKGGRLLRPKGKRLLRRVDGQSEGWTVSPKDGRSVRRVDGYSVRRVDGYSVRRVNGYSEGWTVTPKGGRLLRRVDGYSVRRVDGYSVRRVDAANDFTADLAHLAAPHSHASSWNRKFRTKSKLWFRLSGGIIILWFGYAQRINYIWWLHFKQRSNDTTETFWMANQLKPLTAFLPAWQTVILWCFCSVFPLILSQQVIGIFVLNADFLKEGLRDLNRDIREQIESFGPRRDAKRALDLDSRVMLWTKVVGSSRAFCKELNDFFGTILFGVYGVDFLVLVGFGTILIYLPFLGLETFAFYAYALLMMLAFMTLFLIPLPLAYEESSCVSSNLQDLIDRICYSLTDGDQEGKKLLDRLANLEHSSRTYPCLFQSVRLMYFTRAFLTGTCTLALSLLFLAKELLSDKESPNAWSVNATSA